MSATEQGQHFTTGRNPVIDLILDGILLMGSLGELELMRSRVIPNLRVIMDSERAVLLAAVAQREEELIASWGIKLAAN